MISYLTLHPTSLTVLSLRAEGSLPMSGIFSSHLTKRWCFSLDLNKFIVISPTSGGGLHLLEPTIFSVSFAKGQGGVMDNQDLGMTNPDSSLSHCVTPGQTDKNSEILPVFSHSSTVPPTPYLSSWEDQSFWLGFRKGPFGWVWEEGDTF